MKKKTKNVGIYTYINKTSYIYIKHIHIYVLFVFFRSVLRGKGHVML